MPIAFEKLTALPDCIHLNEGGCSVLGLKTNLIVCSFCQKTGPFRGRSIQAQQMDFFLKTAPVYTGLRVERKIESVKVISKFREAWSKVATSWQMADSFVRSMASRGLQSSRVSDDVLARRRLSCFGDATHDACQYLAKKDVGIYCSACGCGSNKLRDWTSRSKTVTLNCTILTWNAPSAGMDFPTPRHSR